MQNPTPQVEDPLFAENINLRHYWHIILERRWLVITAFISVFVLCLVYLYKAPRVYESATRIEIDHEPEATINLSQAMSFTSADQDYLQTQYKNLSSRSLMQAVYEKLHLKDDPRYNLKLDPVKALAGDVTIAPLRLSRLVDIRVEHTSPQRATDIANAIAKEFIQENMDRKTKKVLDLFSFLKEQADKTQKELEKAQRAQQAYRETNQFVSLDADRNTIFMALSEAQQAYAKARSEAETFETTVKELDKHLAGGKSLETFPPIAEDLTVQKAQVQVIGLENELAGLLKVYKLKHPTVLTALSKVDNAKEAVQSAARQVEATLRSQAQVARSVEATKLATYTEWQDKQQRWNAAKVDYDVLSRQTQTSQTLYDQVLGRMKEIDLVSQDKANNIWVTDPAVVPLRNVKPRVVLTLVLGLMSGLGIAIGLAFFVNYLDDSVKSQDDVETYLHLPFLGYVPNIKSNSVVERDLQAHLHPQSNAAEAFRTVRAAIALTHKADRLHVVSVTSTIPSEGKSLVASNLAIVMAQTGLKILLVDADLRRPSIHKTFQLHSPVGLAAYLNGTNPDVEAVFQTTEVPNLDVVCCGAVPQSPSELIGSERMKQFLQEAGKRYDRVVLDSPPISAVSDPLILAAMSDGVVFVTKFNKIRREHARKTVQRLQDAGIHIFGTVLNDIDFEGRDSYYYSYYYYQNRYYSSHYHPSGPGQPAAPAANEEAKKA